MRLRDASGGELPSIKTPLLAALDLEYIRAVKARNIPRMGEIAAILQALHGLWPGLIPDPEPAPIPLPLTSLVPAVQPPAPPVPVEMAPWSLNELLAAVPEEPPAASPVPLEAMLSDSARRAAAKARIKEAVIRAAENTSHQQMRYEQAMMAKNGNVHIIQNFEAEARTLGLKVAQLADQIIAERRARERRMGQVYAVKARAELDIDKASGPTIDAIADTAILDISTGT